MSASAAIFDVDGTLLHSDVLDYYIALIRRLLPRGPRLRRLAALYLKAPYWFALDQVDRAKFNISFYRSYRGLAREPSQALAQDCFQSLFKGRLYQPVIERLEQHRRQGDRIVLVSGSLDFLLQPLAQYLRADACLCPGLHDTEGIFTGEMTGPPIIGEAKATRLRSYAQEQNLDLASCHAYADSRSDLPILNLAGHVTVVNPGFSLRREAKRRGWEILITKNK